MPEEARGGDERELGFHAGETDLLEPGEDALEDGGRSEADEEGRQQAFVERDQHVVHEHLGDRRDREAGDHQGEGREDDEEERRARVAEPGGEPAQQARLRAAAAEVRAGGEREAYPGEPLVELPHGDPALAFARVVHVDDVSPDPLQHEEVVEVPEHHHREGEVEQAFRIAPVTGRVEAVLARRAQHAGRLDAVARHAAPDPQLFERRPAAVVGEDHREAGGAAFGGLHLQDGGRRAPPASAAEVRALHEVHARPRSCLSLRLRAGEGAGVLRTPAHSPSFFLSKGTTRVMGAWLSTLTSMPASVPEESVRPAALGDVHANPLAVEGSGSRTIRPE